MPEMHGVFCGTLNIKMMDMSTKTSRNIVNIDNKQHQKNIDNLNKDLGCAARHVEND